MKAVASDLCRQKSLLAGTQRASRRGVPEWLQGDGSEAGGIGPGQRQAAWPWAMAVGAVGRSSQVLWMLADILDNPGVMDWT